jgi:hypothetical protein
MPRTVRPVPDDLRPDSAAGQSAPGPVASRLPAPRPSAPNASTRSLGELDELPGRAVQLLGGVAGALEQDVLVGRVVGLGHGRQLTQIQRGEFRLG